MKKAYQIGTAVRRLRESRDLSQGDVERRGKVPKTYVSQVENGRVESPGFDVIVRLCRGLGVTLDDLAVEAGLEPPGPGYHLPEPDEFSHPATRGDVQDALAGVHQRFDLVVKELTALRREVQALGKRIK